LTDKTLIFFLFIFALFRSDTPKHFLLFHFQQHASIMTSHLLFVTGTDTESIVERMHRLKHDHAYRELYISMIDLDDFVSDEIVKVLSDTSRSWDGIHIAHCTGKVEVVISTALELSSVKKLSLLPSGHHIDDPSLFALAKGLKANKTVKTLLLRVDLYAKLAEALAEGLSSSSALEELSLTLSSSDTEAITTLARGIRNNSRLKTLNMNRCSLEDGQIAEFIRGLENHPSLQELSVQGSGCRAMGLVAISGLLQAQYQKPFKLDLSNQLEEGHVFGVSFLASSLPSNKNMRCLDLSSNDLSGVDVTSIASALSENSGLEELRLTNCNIDDRGARIIAEHLPLMTGLKKIWLDQNPFGLKGAQSLLEAMHRNVHLQEMQLPRIKGREFQEIKAKMNRFLLLNKGGRKLLKDLNRVSSGLWPEVLGRVSNADMAMAQEAQAEVIYCLLKNPTLLAR